VGRRAVRAHGVTLEYRFLHCLGMNAAQAQVAPRYIVAKSAQQVTGFLHLDRAIRLVNKVVSLFHGVLLLNRLYARPSLAICAGASLSEWAQRCCFPAPFFI
jgi:hypothetical protein